MYVVYSKNSCAACEAAKLLLETENYEHVVKMLNVDFNILELYEVVPRNVRSFPAILKDGVFIGGLSDLQHDLGVTV